jgi:GT2 family glycosyltransferase
MPKLCVIILNYATPDLTLDCANSALADIAGLDAELIVVDNASPDDSWSRISAWRDGLGASAPVRAIRSERNGGFASGNNIGIRACGADFYVLLNSDTVVRRGAVAALLAALEADPEIGVAGPRIVGPGGETQVSRFRYPSPLGEFVLGVAADPFYRMLRRRVVPIAPDEDAEHDWIGFPCVCLRKTMIDRIGLLDERYFMYFEDCDYCRRAKQDGWKIAYCPQAEVMHLHGQSSEVEDRAGSTKRLPRYFYASRARYFIAWYGRAGFIAANLLWQFGRALGLLRLAALRRPHAAPARRGCDNWTGPDYPQPDGSR